MKGLLARVLPYFLAFFSSLCIMILELVASRLVARHVGASLTVWTSVIGIMLGGICLGNVLGGRLADRVDPVRAIGPLYALGSALTLACLWMNAAIGLLGPGIDVLPWDLRTVVVVTLDFLIPTTVLGMISPVVAKMAVEAARRPGGAIGLVYFLGAVGSIVGTFIAGFYLIYLAPTSTIVAVVAAGLALLAGLLYGEMAGSALALLATALLAAGAAVPILRGSPLAGVSLGSTRINFVGLAGHALALGLAVLAWNRLRRDRRVYLEGELTSGPPPIDPIAALGRWIRRAPRPAGAADLTDLAVLSFIASLAFMALEMVAGRLVTRHLGSSVYGWTSVIGVLLGGLSLGNFLGGKVADLITREKQASWLFLFASITTAAVLLAETPPWWMMRNPFGYKLHHKMPVPLFGGVGSALSQAITMTYAWAPGADLRWHKVAIAWQWRVLFWTAVVFLVPSVAMGTVSPVVAKLAIERVRQSKRTGQAIGEVYAWGMVGSIAGTFLAGFFLIDLLGTKGLLLALATMLALAATALGSVWHAAWAGIPLGLCIIAFAPGAWFEKQGLSWGIREEKGRLDTDKDEIAYTDESNYYYLKVENEPDVDGRKRTLVLDNLIHGYFVLGHPERLDYDYEHIYALVTRRVAELKAKAEARPNPVQAPLNALFLGGGSYTFQRHVRHAYPASLCEVAEIDPAVTRANRVALGLTPSDEEKIRTTWGDARQFAVNAQGRKKFDVVFGDAFNDFSVPWHLTTKQFNDYIYNILGPDGVYMINIIDVYESDRKAGQLARARLRKEARGAAKAAGKAADDGKFEPNLDPNVLGPAISEEEARARGLGAFLGSWVNTARRTFPYIYVFGTGDEPGEGLRETFVVVASKAALKLDDLGDRLEDPVFRADDGSRFRPRPFPESDMKQLDVRSRGIVLTDDYAPVENLLAPVAATRGEEED